MLFFNKDLIAENQLDDPYQLVKDGTWTLDRMYEMAVRSRSITATAK